MVTYLLKSTACLLVFYLFYHFVLERQTNHSFKRYYLLASLVAGLVIPVIPMVRTVALLSPTFVNWVADAGGTENLSGPGAWEATAPAIGWMGYLLGGSLFGVAFVRNLIRLVRKTRKNPRLSGPDHTKVLLSRNEPPHTFFRYLFLFGPAYERGEIPEGILAHEAAHIRQRHSLDLLFMELACLVFWFHPVIWLYRRAVRLNHEFLADREVLRSGHSRKDYQRLLLVITQSSNQPACTHAFHYSSIKKRIIVMKNSTSHSRKWLTCLVLLPLSALLFFSFSDRKTEYLPAGDILEIPPPDTAFPELRGDVPAELPGVSALSGEPRSIQQGATRAEMREYERLARKYNEMLRGDDIHIIGDEVSLMKQIYAKMSDKQRADTEPFPELPPPPPAPDPHPVPAPHSARSPQPAQQAHPPQPAQPAKPRNGEQQEIREVPPPPPAPSAHGTRPGATPPPPPPPPDPEEHLRELASQGADFFYRNQAIPSEKALELFRAGEVNRIQVRNSDGGTPQVYLAE
ncbi:MULTISPECIES: M56 family metallopeptidase [Robiginitalea]|uniref:Peptidase M56 domain-containing protein n=1 Tax=Robiginitalea biformata (strain ATCC BAA-864 / DSM 15991 / KCTC 12146 / HTCC2501) TaxID=313596 RepID=A4CGH7_ROBBH|nr:MULTISPECIES: M56 family metallopeptidase [Robiginitalea]EAR16035.1 hypothetical protein RB2501_04035 [Robiginitalea biformata HTCC2501]MDC6354357.1 M56 family metallopeptidase [Robiginitalea sp. PM2]MDC6374961.1 M56 family metallopeptidase [Robiginitalea sp. SP8]